MAIDQTKRRLTRLDLGRLLTMLTQAARVRENALLCTFRDEQYGALEQNGGEQVDEVAGAADQLEDLGEVNVDDGQLVTAWLLYDERVHVTRVAAAATAAAAAVGDTLDPAAAVVGERRNLCR